MRSCLSSLAAMGIVAHLAFAGLACDENGAQRPFECWYRSFSHGYLSSTPCPLEGCAPTGNGGEVLCACEVMGCNCEAWWHPEIPEDGIRNPFACFWAQENCYQGGPDRFATDARDCDCYAGYFCWMQCEGRLAEDGSQVCMADGTEVECLPSPPQDEEGKVVVCRHGATPVSWPLPD
jgi:hypothetical protein